MDSITQSSRRNITFFTLGIPTQIGGDAQTHDQELCSRLSFRHTVRLVALVEQETDTPDLSSLETWCENVCVAPISTRLSPTIGFRLLPKKQRPR